MPDSAAVAIVVHQDEVLTGEAVALDVQPVGYFLRALGALIDMVLGILIFILFIWAISWLYGISLFDGSILPIITISLLVLITVVIPTAIETITRGRSLGKLAVGGRIVRTDGGATGFRQAFIRALVGVFELWFTLGAVAAIVGAFTPRSQRLGDLLAGTYSERTRTPRLPAYAPGVPAPLHAWSQTADVARLPDRLARRIAQFTHQAGAMQPDARARVAAALTNEAAAFVSPMPLASPEMTLYAIAAVRRERELRGILLENARVASLAAAGTDAPRGFPQR